MPSQAARHMDLLFEVVLKGEIEEGLLQRCKFQGGRSTGLYNRQVACSKVLEKPMNIFPNLDSMGTLRESAVIRGPQTNIIRRSWNFSLIIGYA